MVGRFLVVTLLASAGPPFICAMIVRSPASPTLNENHKQGTLPYTASECAGAEGVVLAAFHASVHEARQWLQLAWIPDGDAHIEETWEDADDICDDGPCPCVVYSSMHVGSLSS